MRQADGMPIGLGLDRNDSTQRIYFENANSEFQLSTSRGALMIRPEFKGPTPPVAAADGQVRAAIAVKVVPNPVQGGLIRLHVSDVQALREIAFELVDLHGRLLQTWSGQVAQAEVRLPLATQPADGIYWLRVHGTNHRGDALSSTVKLIVLNH
jgi:hypothetical protein